MKRLVLKIPETGIRPGWDTMHEQNSNGQVRAVRRLLHIEIVERSKICLPREFVIKEP